MKRLAAVAVVLWSCSWAFFALDNRRPLVYCTI
jgi:hypothetical protein